MLNLPYSTPLRHFSNKYYANGPLCSRYKRSYGRSKGRKGREGLREGIESPRSKRRQGRSKREGSEGREDSLEGGEGRESKVQGMKRKSRRRLVHPSAVSFTTNTAVGLHSLWRIPPSKRRKG